MMDAFLDDLNRLANCGSWDEVIEKLSPICPCSGVFNDYISALFVEMAKYGNVDVLIVLHNKGADVNYIDNGSNAFEGIISADGRYGNMLKPLRWLLSVGGDWRRNFYIGGMNALQYAIVANKLHLVACLLEHGADPFEKSEEGEDSFDIVNSVGFGCVRELLISYSR